MKKRKMCASRVESAKKTNEVPLLLETGYFSIIKLFFALSCLTRQVSMRLKHEKTPIQPSFHRGL